MPVSPDKFDFNDFLGQLQQINKMGNVKDLMGMIPGVGKQIKDADIDENAFKGIEAIILSMTPHERENPTVLNGTRNQRLAKGSGQSIQEVNKLIKQFKDTSKMMQMMNNKKGMMGMMKQMKQLQKGKM